MCRSKRRIHPNPTFYNRFLQTTPPDFSEKAEPRFKCAQAAIPMKPVSQIDGERGERSIMECVIIYSGACLRFDFIQLLIHEGWTELINYSQLRCLL